MVYINKTAHFLPNKPISNDEMEDYLGLINNVKSKSKNIVLRSNKIQNRYYAIDKKGNSTHTNAQLVALAIKKLNSSESNLTNTDLLVCGTSTPDQLIPSHAIMVHGELPELGPLEVVSPAGVCCSGMHALKYAYLAIKSGDKKKAITSGSEKISKLLRSENYEEEILRLIELEENPYIAFEKDFLRWMLSDGAGAFLVEDKPANTGISLKIDWIEGVSFANEQEPCMYMGCEKLEDGSLRSYMDMSSSEITENSVLSVKQDVKQLAENIVPLGFVKLKELLDVKGIDIQQVDYFLPHLSSYFFEQKIIDFLEEKNIGIPKEKWFTNLVTVGNVGSGSIYLMIDALFNSGKLEKGQKILVVVPESARFSYSYCHLTVC
jgi:3-oxoacyl-[acyl-carrier-protein] synthase-3